VNGPQAVNDADAQRLLDHLEAALVLVRRLRYRAEEADLGHGAGPDAFADVPAFPELPDDASDDERYEALERMLAQAGLELPPPMASVAGGTAGRAALMEWVQRASVACAQVRGRLHPPRSARTADWVDLDEAITRLVARVLRMVS